MEKASVAFKSKYISGTNLTDHQCKIKLHYNIFRFQKSGFLSLAWINIVFKSVLCFCWSSSNKVAVLCPRWYIYHFYRSHSGQPYIHCLPIAYEAQWRLFLPFVLDELFFNKTLRQVILCLYGLESMANLASLSTIGLPS